MKAKKINENLLVGKSLQEILDEINLFEEEKIHQGLAKICRNFGEAGFLTEENDEIIHTTLLEKLTNLLDYIMAVYSAEGDEDFEERYHE